MLLSAVAVLIALGQAPSAFKNPLGPHEPVRLTATTAHYDGAHHVVTAEGKCTLTSTRASVKADRMEYDQELQKVTARGHAVAVTGLDVAVADQLEVDFDSGEVRVVHGQIFEKKNVSPEALRLAATPEEAERLGTTTLAVQGTRFRKLGTKELGVDHLQMTPCDCDPLHPHWFIRATSGNVVPGDHAWLFLPVVYVYGVPVLAFPVLNLPLSNRRSGLLVPKPTFSSLNGFSLQVPYFQTLGPAYDLTFTPGYFFGGADPAAGVKGAWLGTEFRYANTTQINVVSLNLLDDLKALRSPTTPDIDTTRKRGLRGSFGWRHGQDLGEGFHDHLDLSFLSDGFLLRDITTDVLQRTNEYVRSTATVNRRTENQYEGLDVTLRQDIRYGYSFVGRGEGVPIATGNSVPPKYGPNPLDRLPAFTFAVPDSKLLGPLNGSLQVEAARLSPLFGRTGDEGASGFYDPATVNFGQGDRHYQQGEREARDRLDFHPSIDTEVGIGSALRLRPYASLREDLYEGELTGASQQRGYGILGAQVSSELSRVFAGGALRHAIVPSAEVRYVPFFYGSPLLVDDEVDRALYATQNDATGSPASQGSTLRGLSQEVFQVSQSLQRRTGNVVQEVARLDLGQEVDSRARGKLGDTFALARVALGPVLTSASIRYDAKERRVTQAWASAHWGDLRRDAVDLRYDGVIDGGSTRLRQGLDMLVGTPYAFAGAGTDRPGFSNQLTAGGTLNLVGGLGLHYDLLMWSNQTSPVGVTPLRVAPLKIAGQNAGLVFAPACDCWRVDVSARVNAVQGSTLVNGVQVPNYRVWGTTEFFFNLTINHFGSFGNAG